MLVELECGRKLTVPVDSDFGNETDAQAQVGKECRGPDRRSHPTQGGRYASLPERLVITRTLVTMPVGDLGVDADVETALRQRRAGAYRIPVSRKAIERDLIPAGHGDAESGRAKAVCGSICACRASNRGQQHA